MRKITSRQNPFVKMVTLLSSSAKERRRSGLCVVEGLRALTTTLHSKISLNTLLVTENMYTHAEQLANPEQIIVVDQHVMNKMSTVTSSPGILGICAIPVQPPLERLGPGLVFAETSNPGNMGTLIRTAAACKARSVVIVEGVDPWSPKVISASAGTIGSVSLFKLSWQDLAAAAAKNNLLLYGLTPQGGDDPRMIQAERALLVIGNEAHGLRPDWEADCKKKITLGMPGKTESLNAAVAGSIALYLSFCLSS